MATDVHSCICMTALRYLVCLINIFFNGITTMFTCLKEFITNCISVFKKENKRN